MHGHFSVELKAARDLRDADFRAARREGALGALLRDLETEERAEGDNLVFNWLAAFLFRYLFSGGDIQDPFDFDSGNCYIGCINLGVTDSEPTYTEFTNNYYEDINSMSDSIGGSGASKRFIEDQIETHLIKKEDDGREAIFLRSRWLWLPSEGVSSNIRSLSLYFARDADGTGGYSERARGARLRLKNQAGLPIIINKTNKHVLLAEYVFTLASV